MVKNGINMTGMPSFELAGAKDEEIWPIVAFLKKLPTVSEADYKSWTRSRRTEQVAESLTAPEPRPGLSDSDDAARNAGKDRPIAVPEIRRDADGKEAQHVDGR